MIEFKVGDRVRFKPEHRNYSMGLGKTPCDKVFTVADVVPGIGTVAKGYPLVNFTNGSGAYGFRLEHADEVPMSEVLYVVIDEDAWVLMDIHDAQEEANGMIEAGMRPMVVKVIAKTNVTLEPINEDRS